MGYGGCGYTGTVPIIILIIIIGSNSSSGLDKLEDERCGIPGIAAKRIDRKPCKGRARD